MIAVLIPVYNNDDGLRLTLQSLSGAGGAFDVVIVDDGSAVPVEIQESSPGNIVVLRLAVNRGIAHALNEGLRYILDHGYQYVARLDSGDLVIGARFDAQRTFLVDHPRVGIVGTWGYFSLGTSGTLIAQEPPTEHRDIHRALFFNSAMSHTSMMLRTELFRRVGLYSTEFPAAEDYELLRRTVRHYELANIPRHLMQIELRPGSISTGQRGRQLRSRLGVQLRYFELGQWQCYAGMLRTLALLVVPPWAVGAFRRLVP